MKKITQLLFVLFTGNLSAQNFHLLNVPVFENGEKLENPWIGGMNAPQWSAIDLNRDGKKDLYYFDRQGHAHVGFINYADEQGEIDYRYERHWLQHFPQGQHYVLMRDYNRDGAADMFVSAFDEGLSGFKVYRGSFNQNNQLTFERIEFPDYDYDIIPFEINGVVAGPVEIYNNPDYPVIDDIDGDGDLDILTMNSSGSKVLYFKNIALESGFNDEVLKFELADDCWGDFAIEAFSPKLTLSTDASTCAFFNEPMSDDDRVHGGAAMCTFDNDNDGDKELLYGDLIYPNVIFGHNGGSVENAWIDWQDTVYPSDNISVEIINFPASFHLDVNNDGARDLIFSPNLPDGAPDVETVLFYENTGSDLNPEFNFNSATFISEEIIDFGTGAMPVFVDVNADGLLDIVLGNREEWNDGLGKSSLFLLLNNGSETDPSFEVSDKDWLGLSQYNSESRSFAPAFGDLDNDGDDDLLIGDRQGFVHFFENVAVAGAPMQFAAPQFMWKEINVGSYSSPFIFDVNNDDLPDLLIGERSGNINYFPNIGTAENPDFHPIEGEAPNNDFFGKITTIVGGSAIGFSQPVILEFNNATYLFSGSDAGWFVQYEINQDSINSGSFNLVTERFGNLREGFISRIGFGNLNNDNYLDAIVGNDRGGLTLFQSPLTIDGTVNDKEVSLRHALKLYPNPAGDYLIIDFEELKNQFELKIYNSIGQVMMSGQDSKDKKININTLSPGVYFIEVKVNGKVYSEKFIKN